MHAGWVYRCALVCEGMFVCVNLCDVEVRVSHGHGCPQGLISRTQFRPGTWGSLNRLGWLVREPRGSFCLHLSGAGITGAHHHAAFCVGSGDQTQATTPVWQTLCSLSHLPSLCESPCKRRKCQKVLQTLRSSQLASSLWGLHYP